MRHLIAGAALVLFPGMIVAQGPAGTNIIVDVRVIGVSVQGDTTTVSYVLRNRAGSAEQLFHFTVDAPSPVITISLPPPENEWDRNVTYRSRSVAEWVALGEQMQPGENSPPLSFSAVGLPDIVTHWIRGYVPPPSLTQADTLPVVRPEDPIVSNSVPGKTVGVSPFPSQVGVTDLLGRMLTMTGQVCGPLNWITNASVCTGLTTKLQQASQAISQGDSSGTRTQLESSVSLLNAQHDSAGTLPVNDNAYWLLKVNAEFILGRLPATPACFGAAATIYVQNGLIVGGPRNGQTYAGTLDGTSANDVIVGTAGRDIVEAGSGTDRVCGLGGDDLIKGQGDADQLDGGDGSDAIEGGAGNDMIVGGGGEDLLKGQDGNDTITGAEGNDTIEGGPGDDDLDGGPGTDTLKGQGGTDRCRQGETVETCETS